MGIRIKKLGPADVSLARDLFTWFQVDDGDPEIYAASDNYLKKLLEKGDFHVIVALEENKLIGGLTAFELPMYKQKATELFLYEIGVDATFRKRNVATDLIEFLKKLAAERGIPEMYVGTQLDNVPAQKLYKKTGGNFEQIAWYVYNLSK